MKKKKSKLGRILLAIVVCYVGYTLFSQELMIIRIKNDIKKYSEANKKVEESNANLRQQIEFSKTDEYKEKIAREKIGLIKEGETVYIIDKEGKP